MLANDFSLQSFRVVFHVPFEHSHRSLNVVVIHNAQRWKKGGYRYLGPSDVFVPEVSPYPLRF
ncbi:MAG: hypothetical protein AAF514_04940 [Verrucomicrobiota bacterium]